MRVHAKNDLLLLAAAVLFSTGGAAIKAATLNSWQVACFRSAISGVVLFALIKDARRGWNWRVLPVSVFYATTLILFVAAAKLTTAANAIFLQSTAPVFIMLISPWLLRERIRLWDALFAVPIGLGMACVFFGTENVNASAPDPATGNVLAAITGLTWGLTIAGLRWVAKYAKPGETSLPTVIAGNILVCIICLPKALPTVNMTWADLGVVVYLGVFQVGLAYYCLTRAMRHVPAFEASALLLVEPPLNPFWTWLIQGERPSVWSIAGGLLIGATTLAYSWWQSRNSSS